MNILTTENVLEQDYNFIPRNANFDGMFITDEQTNVEAEVAIDSITETSYYFVISAVFNLKANRFYTVNIKNGETIVFKDRIFCTDQAPSTFSVNNGQYLSNTTTNEFIVYE